MPSNNSHKAEDAPVIRYELDPLRLLVPNSMLGENFLEVVQPPKGSYIEFIEELVAIANNPSQDSLEDYTDALNNF